MKTDFNKSVGVVGNWPTLTCSENGGARTVCRLMGGGRGRGKEGRGEGSVGRERGVGEGRGEKKVGDRFSK